MQTLINISNSLGMTINNENEKLLHIIPKCLNLKKINLKKSTLFSLLL